MTVEQRSNQLAYANTLCGFIHNHGFYAYANVETGKIHAEMVYSSRQGTFTRMEIVEPTLKAVRDWLGY